MRLVNRTLVGIGLFGLSLNINAQVSADKDVSGRDGSRIITTAVPFLNISPDARAGGMADVGVATSPDANSIYWNPAKLAFIEDSQTKKQLSMGGSLSYTPWLAKLIDDMAIMNLSGFKRISKQEVIGASLYYFDLGDMTFRDENGNAIGDNSPREYAISGVYSRMLSDNLSVGIGAKFINSNLAGNGTSLSGGGVAKPGRSAAADVSVYYTKDIAIKGRPVNMAFGANISNIGSKISYSSKGNSNFIPTNLRLGTAITTEIDAYNKITLAFDANKLLVPTPPTYKLNEDGNTELDENNQPTILDGKDPNRGFISGMFGSFSDAPGGGSEELKEITLALSAEYWYYNTFAARAGIFSENEIKGNRKYMTFGLGLKYQIYGFDFAYLVPLKQNNPLQDTLRFSLLINILSKTADAKNDITNE